MKKSKILAALLAVTMSVFSFAGCLPNGNENDNGDKPNITDTIDSENKGNSTPVESNGQTPTVDNGENKTPVESDEQTAPVEKEPSSPAKEASWYADVGEKYSAVVKPIYRAAKYILYDLVVNGKLNIRHPRSIPELLPYATFTAKV